MEKETKNTQLPQDAVSISHSEIEFHIQKRRQERDRILSCWNEIEKLNEQSKFSMNCYQELQARISSQLAFIDRSIQDHKRIL